MASNRKKCNIVKLALVTAILFAVPIVVMAGAGVNVLQAYVTEQTLTVFTDKGLIPGGLKCVVSNQSAEITASGLLSDEGALIKTTILVDVSTSMPSDIRDGVITSLKKLIEVKSANEELKFIVFGDELNVLHDFSPDRYDLVTAIEKIAFDGTQSKIYDAIYNTIPGISLTDDRPTFYRTIVITDGADNTGSGVTKEELFIKLQNERYPVDVVAASSAELIENKELAAIVRMSGGRYNPLYPDTDVAALVHALGVDDYFYFMAKIPSAMLDGATRQVDISDGVYSVSIDNKFPVYNTPVADTQMPVSTELEASAIIAPESTETPASTIPPLPNETGSPKPITSLFGEYTIVVFIGVGVVLLILIAIIIAVAVTRGKKKKSSSRTEPIAPSVYGTNDNVSKTEFVGDLINPDSQYTIKLSDPNDPIKTWTLPVTGDLLIGRAEHCHLRLDDKSVSREQCKITVQGSSLVAVHMGSTNKTLLNGSNVVGNPPIQSGDTLKFGRVILRIDFIQALGNSPLIKDAPQEQRNGETESIFSH